MRDIIRTENVVSILGEMSAPYRANKMAEEWQGPTLSVHFRGVTYIYGGVR